MFAHIIALVLDRTARISPVNVVVPFLTDYGAVQIGLGTIAFDIIMIVTVTSWLRSRMNNTLWMWIHRTSYVAFVAIFFHAALSGTDFDAPLVVRARVVDRGPVSRSSECRASSGAACPHEARRHHLPRPAIRTKRSSVLRARPSARASSRSG